MSNWAHSCFRRRKGKLFRPEKGVKGRLYKNFLMRRPKKPTVIRKRALGTVALLS